MFALSKIFRRLKNDQTKKADQFGGPQPAINGAKSTGRLSGEKPGSRQNRR